RKEGLKQIGLDVIVESGPGIGHRNLDHGVRDRRVRCDKLPLRRLRHRLKGVAKKIDQDLLNLDPIHQDQIEFRVQIETKLNVLLTGTRQTERTGLFNQLREAFYALFGFSSGNEVAKTTND